MHSGAFMGSDGVIVAAVAAWMMLPISRVF
jgi:hypothetical protein